MTAKDYHLIIVESPSKAKTLKKFLGDNYLVEASVGHIRDLPKSDLGIDPDKNFKTTYVETISRANLKNLKSCLNKASELYLATDPDREGEAIAWHLVEALKPSIPIKRLVFNEITKDAILDSFNNTREIDVSLVNAQETRRVIDRLLGFPVSNKLWKNVASGLSAGRVQSPAIKIVVDREKERSGFVKSEYWSISAKLIKSNIEFEAKLLKSNNKNLATGKDFNKKNGELTTKDKMLLDNTLSNSIIEKLKNSYWKVLDVQKKPYTQNPYPPFITSTLQQDGIRKLHTSSKNVMRLAQNLYQAGYITYMRTDSINIANQAVEQIRNIIKKDNPSNLPNKPRTYKNKVKNAQEAHEAIRPAGNIIHPKHLKSKLDEKEWKLYDLIWKRTVASQMKSAKIINTVVSISASDCLFEARGKTIEFPGFLSIYNESTDSKKEEDKALPILNKNDSLNMKSVDGKQHFTKPIGRFTEASLVKELEALGIGRPSTYATIMDKIQLKYINKINGAMVPNFSAYAVVQFLESNFEDLVDLQYTASLEDNLDQISNNKLDYINFLNGFWFGDDNVKGLNNLLNRDIDINTSKLIKRYSINDDTYELKIGKFGVYIDNNGKTTNVYDDIAPDQLNNDKVLELFSESEKSEVPIALDIQSNEPIFLKVGRYGPYLKCQKKMKSLLPGQAISDVTPEIAQKIMGLPKEIGKWDETDDIITLDIGRYGPYIKAGKINASVYEHSTFLDMDLNTALELLKNRKNKSPQVIKDLGKDEDGNKIEIKKGRYGPYITNQKINAPFPKDKEIESMDLNTAQEIIAAKKAKGPTKFKRKKKK
ncbi:MAG: DNA topoisomerase I [Candidatus Marinimicrobia bacterium]|nr:DNA topoisomerase I [Candidatus Neomarinimicrobiota bacterium]|tara:strand:+ start:23888 stop:26356 length:2469 start_codon:yes stop_codon:yes gene_type:complete